MIDFRRVVEEIKKLNNSSPLVVFIVVIVSIALVTLGPGAASKGSSSAADDRSGDYLAPTVYPGSEQTYLKYLSQEITYLQLLRTHPSPQSDEDIAATKECYNGVSKQISSADLRRDGLPTHL